MAKWGGFHASSGKGVKILEDHPTASTSKLKAIKDHPGTLRYERTLSDLIYKINCHVVDAFTEKRSYSSKRVYMFFMMAGALNDLVPLLSFAGGYLGRGQDVVPRTGHSVLFFGMN